MVNEGQHYATSYALKADELYYGFPTEKYIRLDSDEIPSRYHGNYRMLYGELLRYFFYLLIKDIIENLITFKFPPGTRAWIQMDPVSGEDFVRARLNGAFDDVDYLASNFTGYLLYLRYNTRYGHWTKLIHVSKKFKDRITELTNKGVGW